MGRDRAAYMREYRRRQKAGRETKIIEDYGSVSLAAAESRIHELEAEVARLKRELAARPSGPAFNSKPFTPVPKR